MKLLLITFTFLFTQARIIKRNDEITFPDDDQDEVVVESNEVHLRFDNMESEMSNPTLSMNSEFNEDFFQGDIKLTQGQEYFINNPNEGGDDDDETGFRTGLLDDRYRWPKREGKVVVPYKIDPEAEFAPRQKNMIHQAMRHLKKYTCITFKQRTNERDYVEITSHGGCYSYLGRIGGKQIVSLQRNSCFVFGTVVHELIHSLGYDHMHNHANRDDFIEIKWNNISPDFTQAFKKVDDKVFSNFGTPYDYMSVMHYYNRAGSKNNLETIIPKKPFMGDKIGQRRGLSRGDIARINNMYQCNV